MPERTPSAVRSSPHPSVILKVENVERRFGGFTAVDVDHLTIRRGEITALIGPNGAGKTTLFNLLTGFDRPDAGQWTFDGYPLAGVPPHKVARMGMVRTFQLTKVLARLTVLENMRIAAPGQLGERLWMAPFSAVWRRGEKENTSRARALLARFLLDDKRDELAGSLSGGQRKLLEMARALMVEPRMVMLDEPMAGVNPALKQSLLKHIVSLRDDGVSVLFVEHDMDMVHEISDNVVVMAQGRVIAEGTAREVTNDERVVGAYLGEHFGSDLDETAAALSDEGGGR
ncbi:ABC transporter ATP-binding protein [Streptosporangium subroseum]|uniref:ABC transporter ATP-binding protein n=1 Tax=Streptosporangium subroseum TaxID=106412 RepID=UPI0030891BF1|nr:ABC transporter ATP-binding protein [Streptosporangium subroseum]